MKKIALNTSQTSRHATWLELFYDLVYVVVIARLVHHVTVGHHGDVTLYDYFIYIVLFIPVWWAWTGHTMFENRFGNNDFIDRFLTLLQMFFAVLLAVFIVKADSDYSQEFAITYGIIRFILVIMYLRVHVSNKDVRHITSVFISGFGFTAILWLGSAFLPAPYIYWVWVAAILIDMLTPVLLKKHLNVVSVHAEHLPERTGLLVIILLGESVLSIVSATDSMEWNTESFLNLFIGFSLVSCVWWLYFDTLERTLMGRLRGAAQLHIYGHLPVYIGLGLQAAAIQHLVLGDYPDSSIAALLCLSVILILLSIQVIHFQHIDKLSRTNFLTRGALVLFGLIVLPFIASTLNATVVAIIVLAILVIYILFEQRMIGRECSEV
jgi:low temperature requirement protein LtrA